MLNMQELNAEGKMKNILEIEGRVLDSKKEWIHI